jgi:hypothetical protein
MKHSFASALLLLGGSSIAPAAVILSDSFDYPLSDNASLAGNYDSEPLTDGLQPTGIAPNGVWTSIHQTGAGLVYKSTGLSFGPITGSGGAVSTTGSSAAFPSASARLFDPAAVPTTDGNTYWGRILIDFNDILPTRNLVTLGTGLGNTTGDAVRLFSQGGNSGVGFEMFNNSGAAYLRPTIGLTGGTGTAGRAFGADLTFDHLQTNLVVFRLTFGATDTVDLWLNPSSLADEGSLGAPSSTVSSANTNLLGSSIYFREDATGGDWRADEFVLGTTFADISVIPEPSAVASLMGLGALLFATSRRRRAS